MSGRHNIRIIQGSDVSGVAALCILGIFLAVCLVLLPPRFFPAGRPVNSGWKIITGPFLFFEQAQSAIHSFLSRSPLTAADRFRLNARHGRALYLSAKNIWEADGLTPEAYTLLLRSRKTWRGRLPLKIGAIMLPTGGPGPSTLWSGCIPGCIRTPSTLTMPMTSTCTPSPCGLQESPFARTMQDTFIKQGGRAGSPSW